VSGKTLPASVYDRLGILDNKKEKQNKTQNETIKKTTKTNTEHKP
jgi:hypothetical protein